MVHSEKFFIRGCDSITSFKTSLRSSKAPMIMDECVSVCTSMDKPEMKFGSNRYQISSGQRPSERVLHMSEGGQRRG